jgi:hypothetical protein
MSGSASLELVRLRLKVSIPPLLNSVQESLAGAEGKDGLLFLLVTEEEARICYECLYRLGLTQDAQQLAKSWRLLRDWTLGPAFDDVLARWAASEPDKAPGLREWFGEFPSAEKLATSQNRRLRYGMALTAARGLADQLQQLQTVLGAEATQPLRGSTEGEKGADDLATLPVGPIPGTLSEDSPPAEQQQLIDREILAIALLWKNPELSLGEIAERVGVKRQTIYKWPKFLEAAGSLNKYTPAKRAKKGARDVRGSKSKDGAVDAWHGRPGHPASCDPADGCDSKSGQAPDNTAWPRCAARGCGDPAGQDDSGQPLEYRGTPYCKDCYTEMVKILGRG